MAKNKKLDVIYIIRCIFICISFCTYNDVKAQHMVARPIPFFYQLYSNEVFDIYQDRTGYLWFGMTSGLARYDGYRLHTFRSNYKHPDLLSDNRVVYITDNDRYVWIATGVGITLYDKQTWKTTKILDKKIKDLAITDIVTNPSTPDFDKMCTYKITYPNFQAFSKNNLCKWVTQRLFFVSLHHVCT